MQSAVLAMIDSVRSKNVAKIGISCTLTHRSGFLPAPIRMTLNDLECPIHPKVRLVDGTLDVRTLWLSNSTIRIGVARGGGGGVGWRA